MKVNEELYNTDYHAGIFNKYLTKTVYQRDKERNILSLITPRQKDNILEIGCSAGASVFLLAEAGANSIGIDFDEAAIQLAENYRQNSFLYPDRCKFLTARVEEIIHDEAPNKVIMIDFTEHISDLELKKLLTSLKQNPHLHWKLFIYTPNPNHWIEFLKRHKLLIKQDPSHTDLRTMNEYLAILEDCGYEILTNYYRPFHIPLIRSFDSIFSVIPFIGSLFKRRINIVSSPTGA